MLTLVKVGILRGAIPTLRRRIALPGRLGGGSLGGAGGTSVPLAQPGGDASVGYRPAPLAEAPPATLREAASARWVVRIVDTVNNALRGKLNVTHAVTLAPNAPSTTIVDARISAFSALLFVPLSANAAVEHATGTMYISSQRGGRATVEHTNNGQVDRHFRMVILS